MLTEQKLNKIRESSNFWALVKQNVDRVTMCYVVYALKKWQEGGCIGGLQAFFDEHKTLPEYGSLASDANYRIISNADKFGFVYPGYKNNSEARITPAFNLIDKICNGNFAATNSYQHIVDSQLEKLYYINEENNFHIHTIMFLLKVLITLGDITGSYELSFTEMKLFVVNATKWADFLETVASIIRYRQDDAYKEACDKEIGKFKDSRYNLLAKNISYIDMGDNMLSIKPDKINDVRRKLARFESQSAEERDRLMNAGYLGEPQTDSKGSPNVALQRLYYGAPGSGKSRAVRIETENKPQTRVTFHPDTDYSSFVGAYKPSQDGDKIRYRFVPQQFAIAYVKAWKQHIHRPGIPYYFIIEEINRGNCAQIFGDIFQLLDRSSNGFSEYPIDIDADFADYIYNSLTEDERKIYYSHFKQEGDEDSKSKILLPPNFYILATMNTSDQSLFPMDSAFKRRWEWIYVPIDHEDASKTTIVIDDEHQYNWGKFIVAVNDRIFRATGSPDKQLGNRFVQIDDDRIISLSQFQGKVLFYLWEEVFKDNKKFTIFDKDSDFYKIYDDTSVICRIIENLGVDNLVIHSPEPEAAEEPTDNE